MTQRADIKKLRRQLNIGDDVTWGNGLKKHKIVDITNDRVIVDVTSEPECEKWASKQSDGRFFYGIHFHSNRGIATIRKVDK